MPMTTSIKILVAILRIVFLLSIILGLALWTGHGYAYLQLHMWLGFVITFDLLILSLLGLLSRVSAALPIIAIVWAVLLPVIGISQLHLMPGPSHWVIRVVHLILGLGAIGLGEALAKRTLAARKVVVAR